MAQHEITRCQAMILQYMQKFGKILDGDVELANKLALGYGSTVNQALKKLEKYHLVEINRVAGSRMVRTTDVVRKYLVITEELKGKNEMVNMFDKNFFPSPEKVIDLLLENVNAIGCKRILEPSAGKGDLVKGIQNKTHQREITIDVIEKNEDLCAILQSKGLAVVANDFLEFNTNTEYSHIIMNPPFDTGYKHLLHAIELAERQIEPCAISCILNANTLENTYSDSRKALLSKIELYGGVITYHDNLFSEAERKTNVRCAVVSLTANAVSAEVKFNYSKLIDDLDFSKDEQLERSLSTTVANNEIGERVADIKRYVSQYARHVELVKDMYIAKKSINYFENISDIWC